MIYTRPCMYGALKVWHMNTDLDSENATLECFKSPPVTRRIAAGSWIIFTRARREENSRSFVSLTEHLTANATVIPPRDVTHAALLSSSISLSLSRATLCPSSHKVVAVLWHGGTNSREDKRESNAVDYRNAGWQSVFRNAEDTYERYRIADGLRNTVTSLACPFRRRIYIRADVRAHSEANARCNLIVCIRSDVFQCTPVNSGDTIRDCGLRWWHINNNRSKSRVVWLSDCSIIARTDGPYYYRSISLIFTTWWKHFKIL